MKDPGAHREAVVAAVRAMSCESVDTVVGCTDPILRIGKTKAVDADPLFENDPWKKLKQDPLVHPQYRPISTTVRLNVLKKPKGTRPLKRYGMNMVLGFKTPTDTMEGVSVDRNCPPYGCGHPPRQDHQGYGHLHEDVEVTVSAVGEAVSLDDLRHILREECVDIRAHRLWCPGERS